MPATSSVVPQGFHPYITSGVESLPQLNCNDRVHHQQWGIGRVLQTAIANGDEYVTVRFGDGIREVPRDLVRRVLPVTVMAKAIHSVAPHLSTWDVRKANHYGAIRPDVIGRFAGHKVHYYEAVRIPELIEQVSCRNEWPAGTLVIHSQKGSGRIISLDPNNPCMRSVRLFSGAPVEALPVEELRRLIPGHRIASKLGVNRKTFARFATRRGISPDYVAERGRVRLFYDEGRIDQIRRQWTEYGGPWTAGRVAIDDEGEIVRIESTNANGQVSLREVHSRRPARIADTSTLHEMVSLRELARSEKMSRYKLNRLLSTAGIKPAYRDGKTLYFDREASHKALRARMNQEENAVTISALSALTGISRAVLANKIRMGCIHTLGHRAMHIVDRNEAARVLGIVRAMQSASDNLQNAGICKLQRRGSAGTEAAGWNIDRFLELCASATPERQSIVIGQVAWRTEGSGGRHLHQELDRYLARDLQRDQSALTRQNAALLLRLIDSLPGTFSVYRIRLSLIAGGEAEIWRSIELKIEDLARNAGCDDQRLMDRFRGQVYQSLAEVLQQENASHDSAGQEDYTAGTVVVSVTDTRAACGVVEQVEQRCWDTVAHCWHNTLLVRFAHGEKRISLSPRQRGRTCCRPALPILLSSSRAAEVLRLLQASTSLTTLP